MASALPAQPGWRNAIAGDCGPTSGTRASCALFVVLPTIGPESSRADFGQDTLEPQDSSAPQESRVRPQSSAGTDEQPL
jgi:hypothetical protein